MPIFTHTWSGHRHALLSAKWKHLPKIAFSWLVTPSQDWGGLVVILGFPFGLSRVIDHYQFFLSLFTFYSVQFSLSVMSDSLRSHGLQHPGLPVHHQLPELAQTQSTESALHNRRPEYWSFSFSIRPFNEYSGLICFRIDWFDLLAVQETLKSLL